MTLGTVPLSVLDLAPISAGSTVAEALRNTVDLARAAERAGYRRYWLAEHHLNPGVAGASPPLLIQAVAQATTTIRVGSGAVQTGHRTPLSVVEEFGILDALYPMADRFRQVRRAVDPESRFLNGPLAELFS